MSAANASAGKSRILVVDDNAAYVENLAEILAEARYAVHTASSCAKAQTEAVHGFDVALVDLKLPDGDGIALAAQLTEKSPDSEVVLLTGFATLESAAAAVRAGACAYLVKPCATPELLLTVEQALRKVRLRQEKRELAQRAQVAEKLAAVGTLTAGLSHEIRNPLNAAALQLSIAERRVSKLPEELKEPILQPLTLVRDEIRRLEHTLQDFLEFARPRELNSQAVALDELLLSVVSFLSGQALTHKVRLEQNVATGLKVQGDEHRLRQVFLNLLLNAIDAAAPDGWARVTARMASPSSVEVEVEDSGRGIPPEIRNRIFEPFFTTKPSGSGLGLPIVHSIITQHDGTIRLLSREGRGACFAVALPVAR